MKVAHHVATFIAKTLNVDPSLMVDKCIGQGMRLNYYPPYMTTPEKVIGLSPHFDGCFLTLLLEVNSVEGLQIRRHGSWVPVKTQAKALLVNAGDFLEVGTIQKLIKAV
jgi:isopenicillin N synthase-like dioxygenase